MLKKLGKLNFFTIIPFVGFLAIVFFGFIAVGSPAERRAKKFDEEKLSNLKMITREVDRYSEQNQKIPGSLQFLKDNLQDHEFVLNDPNTGEPYKYRSKDDYSYEICANFEAEYQPEEVVEGSGGYGFSFFDIFGVAYDGKTDVRTYVDREWYYEPGEWCFERDLSDVIGVQTAPPHNISN